LPTAREAPFYGLSGDCQKAEDTILFPRLLRNRKSNARKSGFRAFDYGRFRAEFRAFDYSTIALTFPEEISSFNNINNATQEDPQALSFEPAGFSYCRELNTQPS
jgi:hypothetical protein